MYNDKMYFGIIHTYVGVHTVLAQELGQDNTMHVHEYPRQVHSLTCVVHIRGYVHILKAQ